MRTPASRNGSFSMLRPFLASLLLASLALAGCSGGRGARPARPDDATSIPVLLAAADSAAELGAGLASLTLGDSEPARRSLMRAVELDPRSAEAHVALGRFHAAVRRYADAKVEFDRAAAIDTVSAEPLYRLGLAAAAAGDTKLAAESFSRALARDPNHAPTQAAI